MRRLHHQSWTLLFLTTILFLDPYTVLANEEDGGHELEVEVNGYHITLTSQNEWSEGENTIVVSITDGMGLPLRDAVVEILITPRSEGHAESESDSHGSHQANAILPGADMGNASPQDSSMPGMDMGTPGTPVHGEEPDAPIAMMESKQQGLYIVQTHLDSTGEHEVRVMFHVDGEMLQADFVIAARGVGSKGTVLWSFAAINVALVLSARIMRRRAIVATKGGG
jgi:hypothetical protein